MNVFVRPSELRASLMARARLSSAKLHQQQQQELQRTRSESFMLLEKGSRLSGLSNQRYISVLFTSFIALVGTPRFYYCLSTYETIGVGGEE